MEKIDLHKLANERFPDGVNAAGLQRHGFMVGAEMIYRLMKSENERLQRLLENQFFARRQGTGISLPVIENAWKEFCKEHKL